MTERLRSDFWVSALLRRCGSAGVPAMLRRRGAAEAGAVLVVVDRLDGTASLFGPAPQSLVEDRGVERRFVRMHEADAIASADVERRVAGEIRFDSDLWIVEIEDRAGRSFLDLDGRSRS